MEKPDDFAALENNRRKRLRYLFLTWALIWIGAIISLYFFIGVHNAERFIGAYGIVITVFLSFWAFQIFNNSYRTKLKKQFLEYIAKKYDLKYGIGGVFSIDEVLNHHIIPAYDTKHIEDGFFGTVKDVPIQIQEVHLETVHRDKDGNENIRDVFRGLMIRIKLKTILDFHTIVLPRNPTLTWLKTKMSWETRQFEFIGLPLKFQKKFDVISTDQVESRVIFNPDFMERFLDLCSRIKARALSASFKDNELFIMAHTRKNHFELGHLLRPLGDKDLALVEEDLSILANIIETLKLDTRSRF